MTTRRWLDPTRAATGVGWLVIAYGVAMLASLLFVAWLFAILLFDSWGVSAWVLVGVVLLVAAAVGWAIDRESGLIRVALAVPIGAICFVCIDSVGTSSWATYPIWAAWVVAIVYVPRLAARRYERRLSATIR